MDTWYVKIEFYVEFLRFVPLPSDLIDVHLNTSFLI